MQKKITPELQAERCKFSRFCRCPPLYGACINAYIDYRAVGSYSLPCFMYRSAGQISGRYSRGSCLI